jgi:hypothetical protein
MSRNQATAVLRDNAEDLRSYLMPAVANARDVVAPALVTAGTRARDVVVDEVLPRVKDGLAATEPLRHEAASRATAAAHALAGHTTAPRSRHLGRKAVMVTLIGAGAAAAWRAWKLPHDSDDWMHADSSAASPGNGNAAPAPPTHV